jgi:hypothetical protein
MTSKKAETHIIRFLGAACGMTGFFLLGLGGTYNSIIGTGLTGIGGVLLAYG